MSRFISLIVLLASIVIIGALFYKVMIGFFVPVFLAAVMVVVFRPLHRWVLTKVGQRDHLAAGITTALVIFSVLLPTALIITMAAVQGTGMVAKINESSINVGLSNARKRWGLQSPCQENIRLIQTHVEEIQRDVGSSSASELASPSGKLAVHIEKVEVELGHLLPTLRAFLEDEARELDKEQKLAADAQYEAAKEAWKEPIARVRERLDALKPVIAQAAGENPREGPTRLDLMDLQANAVALGEEWQKTKEILLGGNRIMASLREFANPSPKQLRDLTSLAIGYLQPKIISITGATAEFLVRLIIGLAIMIVSLYFFLYDGPRMIRSLMKLSPLDDRYEMELLIEFDRISRAIVLAMILSAIVQGLTAGLGYYAAGMPSLVLLILLSVLCGLIPFVGPSVIWVPVCIYLAVYEERYIAASLLAIWGMVAVASVDNVVKAYVLHGQSHLHPLLALLSVLGGVQALGPIGLIVGPISVVLLQTLLSILQRELSHFDQGSSSSAATTGEVGGGKSMSNWLSRLKPRHQLSTAGSHSGGKPEIVDGIGNKSAQS